MPIRSQIRNAQTAASLSANDGRRHQRQVAPMPGHPIDEEQDMAAFFLHHRLEGFDQFGREIAGTLAPVSNRPKAKKLSMHSL